MAWVIWSLLLGNLREDFSRFLEGRSGLVRAIGDLLPVAGQGGTISGAGGLGSLVRGNLGEFSVFCKVRSELLRPILDHLDPVKHLRISS